MKKQVCLFLIYQGKNNDYDTYDSAVVAAYTVDEAKEIHPNDYMKDTISVLTAVAKAEGYSSGLSDWAKIQHIKVDYIGIADIHIKAGDIICSSFNAG